MRTTHRRQAGRTPHPACLRPVLAALCMLAFAGPALAGPEPASKRKPASPRFKPITVFAVRHAEKLSTGGSDPDLSEDGRARARMLASMLANAGVTHLMASSYKRTKQTLEPLASATGLQVDVIGNGDPGAQSEAIHTLPAGSVVVVAGHANTVPELVRMLGGEVGGLVRTEHGAIIDEAVYDRIFQVILPPIGQPSRHIAPLMVELRFPPLPAPASAGGSEGAVEVEGGADHR